MPKKFKLRPTGRAAPSKRPTRTYAKRPLKANPRLENTVRDKIFGPLPARLGAKIAFNSDPLYYPQDVVGMAVTPGIVSSSYLFLNVLDMSSNSPTKRGGPTRAYWHNTHMAGLMSLYQEFALQTSYIKLTFHLDAWASDPKLNTMSTCQIVASVVPLTYLRNTNNVQHIANDCGTFYSGVDYFGMLSGMPGAKLLQLTADGSNGPQTVSFKIDGRAHNNLELFGEARVKNAFVDPNVSQTQVEVFYPHGTSIADQQVVLLAFRWLQLDSNQFAVRTHITCDQHYTFQNPQPTTQYLFYQQGTEFPDDR